MKRAKLTTHNSQLTTQEGIRPSLRVLGLVLAGVPWVTLPAGFSLDQLGESKALTAAAGVTLCLILLLREQLTTHYKPGIADGPVRTAAGEKNTSGIADEAVRDPRKILLDPFHVGAALIVVGLIASALASPVKGLGLATAIPIMLWVVFSVCLGLRPASERELRWVLGCLGVSMGLQSCLALGQYFAPGPIRELTPWGTDQAGRAAVAGTIGNPEYLAGWLCAGLAGAVAALWRGGAKGRFAGLAWATAALTLSVIFLSGGRGAAVSAAGAVLLVWSASFSSFHKAPRNELKLALRTRLNPALRTLSIVLLIIALVLVWYSSRPEQRRGGLPARLAELADPYSPSMRHRLGLLIVTSRMILDHPILGVGPGRFGWGYGTTQAKLAAEEKGVGFWALGDVLAGNYAGEAHCDPLQWWAEFGLLPVLGLTLMLARALAGSARVFGESGPAGAACWAGLAALAINMWVAFPLQRPVRGVTFWVLLGLVAGLVRKTKKGSSE